MLRGKLRLVPALGNTFTCARLFVSLLKALLWMEQHNKRAHSNRLIVRLFRHCHRLTVVLGFHKTRYISETLTLSKMVLVNV